MIDLWKDLGITDPEVIEAARAIARNEEAARRLQEDVYVAWTHWQPVKGPVRTHVYGPFVTRSKAQSWGNKMAREEAGHGTADTVFDASRNQVTSREGVLTWKVHKMIDDRKWDNE